MQVFNSADRYHDSIFRIPFVGRLRGKPRGRILQGIC